MLVYMWSGPAIDVSLNFAKSTHISLSPKRSGPALETARTGVSGARLSVNSRKRDDRPICKCDVEIVDKMIVNILMFALYYICSGSVWVTQVATPAMIPFQL